MQILQRRDFRALVEQRFNSPCRRVRRRQRGDARNVIANRRAANGFFVVKRFSAQRSIDNQIDFRRF